MKPHWKRCVEATDNDLGEALGKKYVEKTFSPEAKARMQEMVKNILLALHDDIQTLTWMSDDTKKKALEKLATFNPKVGYPDKWKDYSTVEITRDAYWADVVSARRFAVKDDAQLIGKPVDRGRWGMTTPTSNAYYNPQLNEIVFPAGILLPPMFDVNASDAVNYGGIGPVIGHEISHGFDDQGAQYDATGELKNWWTPADYKDFQSRGKCVVDQFDSYTVDGGLHENGKLVLGESIGDLGGVKLAYLAFEKSMQGKPRPADQNGFTPEQQFFISWGQSRGDEIRPDAQRQFVLTNPHPVSKYRVLGPLSNLPEFQKAFSCKAGDTMVRADGESLHDLVSDLLQVTVHARNFRRNEMIFRRQVFIGIDRDGFLLCKHRYLRRRHQSARRDAAAKSPCCFSRKTARRVSRCLAVRRLSWN